ncbi:MAG: hypothetical protein LDLANPLL_01322 [Turneriella sp.]|nr:hypothetical protein [Turneriella sp.]
MLKKILRIFNFDHPLWMGAFRPLFFLSALFGIAVVLLWPFLYFKGWYVSGQVHSTGIVQAHGYQMLVGFILAALAGFLLTAIAEFTNTAFLSKKNALYLICAWLLGRFAFFVPGFAGAIFVALTDVFILFLLLGFVVRRLNWHYWKKHYDFVFGLAFLLVGVIGYHATHLKNNPSVHWLRVVSGAWVVLVITAMSRISMRMVNEALEKDNSDKKYLARPPRKHLAMLCVAIFTVAEFRQDSPAVLGWLALASSAAVLNLLNDWHIERVIFRRWVLPLYVVYLCMALGYALLGLGHLLGWSLGIESAARHFLFIGAMGVSVFMVFNIAGRTHSGHSLDTRAWVPIGVQLLLGAVIFRFLYGYFAAPVYFWLSALLWVVAFSLSVYYMAPIFFAPRPDGLKDASG